MLRVKATKQTRAVGKMEYADLYSGDSVLHFLRRSEFCRYGVQQRKLRRKEVSIVSSRGISLRFMPRVQGRDSRGERGYKRVPQDTLYNTARNRMVGGFRGENERERENCFVTFSPRKCAQFEGRNSRGGSRGAQRIIETVLSWGRRAHTEQRGRRARGSDR